MLTALVRIAPVFLIASCVAVLLVFILLAQYAHPSSDDFCMASGINQHGLLTQLWNHYFEWSGRYSGNALYAFYPLMFDLFDAYRFIPAIVIAALFTASAFLLSTLFATRLFAGPVMLASVAFVCIYLLGMLSPASGLYWMAGAFTYQTANVLFLVTLALMFRLVQRQRHAQGYAGLLFVLLLTVVIAVGANETSMLAFTAVALLAVLLHLRSGWAMMWPWLAILMVTLVCFAVVYFSPGNEIRAADFPLRHDITRSIKGSLTVGPKILWIWISSPVLIVSSMLAPLAVARLMQARGGEFSGASVNISNSLIAVLLMCTFALPVVLQFPAWWSMGGWPPPRTVDAVYFLFLLSWFLTIGLIAARFMPDNQAEPVNPSGSVFAMASVLVLSLLFSVAVVHNRVFTAAKNDLFQHARPYHDYLNQRYQYIARALADEQRNLVVAEYHQPYPRTIYFNDIMHDSDHWRNVCYADYFGLEKIKIQQGNAGGNRR